MEIVEGRSGTERLEALRIAAKVGGGISDILPMVEIVFCTSNKGLECDVGKEFMCFTEITIELLVTWINYDVHHSSDALYTLLCYDIRSSFKYSDIL
jgi:hypothetical protein